MVFGGKRTVSRLFFVRPLPLSFCSKGCQQAAQISNSLPSISFWRHSFASLHKSQVIIRPPQALFGPDQMKRFPVRPLSLKPPSDLSLHPAISASDNRFLPKKSG